MALILGSPTVEFTLAELAVRTEIPYASLHREIERATAAGLITRRNIGRTILVQADTTSPYYSGLSDILTKAFGVPRVAGQLLNADWARYPDFHADALRQDLARLHGHPWEGVLVGNGSNELLSLALTALVGSGGEVLGAEPSFGLYRSFVLKACGGNRSEAARRLGIGRNTLLRKIGED